ncbi:MAG: fructose-bisphosphate aldolase class I [Gammaproteobacteria bacterium]|jgi:fructose-bisphosphate aldolase class I|nr:fructose-bisphosphate aldolase class I [Gammaproteobacteria bacterium]
MRKQELERVARAMVAEGKGILAADESAGTIRKRFAAIGVESTEALRHRYREALLTAPGMAEYISGVILFDETLRQSTHDGQPFAEWLQSHGVVPGIKVDRGTTTLAGCPGSRITEGLDGLRERLYEYQQLGARFAKWRAVIDIDKDVPTAAAISANAHALARYAALCQEADLVPIVEPEVLMDGTHSLQRCEAVTDATLLAVFAELVAQGVALEAMVLKPNMVISGAEAPERASASEVAEATLRCMRRRVPAAVPGIAFLSGGQSPLEATRHLALLNHERAPWRLTFSYGRALQEPALQAWAGKASHHEAAQREFLWRARLNARATAGIWRESDEVRQ